MSAFPIRPATLRQAISALLASFVLFGFGLFAAKHHSTFCVPLLTIATVALLWGARRPSTTSAGTGR